MRFCLLRCQLCCRHRARAYVLLTLRGEGPFHGSKALPSRDAGQAPPVHAKVGPQRNVWLPDRGRSRRRVPHLRLVVDMFLPDAARLIRTYSENTLFQFLETNHESELFDRQILFLR